MPLYDELGGDSSFLRERLRFSYTMSYLRYTEIQHSNGKRGQSTFFIPRSKHFPSAHINTLLQMSTIMEKHLTMFFPNHIYQYNIHLSWLKCQLSAKSNLFHVSDHNTKLIEFHVNETAGAE